VAALVLVAGSGKDLAAPKVRQTVCVELMRAAASPLQLVAAAVLQQFPR
jgi:hypothetical protein